MSSHLRLGQRDTEGWEGVCFRFRDLIHRFYDRRYVWNFGPETIRWVFPAMCALVQDS